MSIVFGVFAADGAPIRAEDLAAMGIAARLPAHQPVSIWHDRDVALGAARLVTTPESSDEHLPLRHEPTGITLTAHVRLDNRSELQNALGLQGGPDAEIVLRAYLEWGEAFAEHLLGDFSIAVWDPRIRKLVLVRDHAGTSPLFYHSSGPLCVFSNSTNVVLAHPSVPKEPDLLRLGQVLASWPGDGIQTAYKAILRVPSGHMLIAGDSETTVRPYWSIDPGRTLIFRDDQECLEAFSSLYSDAVACRLRSSRAIGISLSGGLDSGSVCALATCHLGDRALHAFTSVPARPAELFGSKKVGDETPFTEAYRESAPNLEIVYCKAEGVSPLQGIDLALARFNEPVHGATNLFWMTSMAAEAQARDIGVLLTGQMGNFTVSLNVPGLMTPRRLAREVLLASWARPLRNLARRVMAGGEEPWLAISPLNREFVRKMRLTTLRRQSIAGAEGGSTDPERARLELIRLCLRMTGSAWHELGAGYGFEVLDPTADKRIIEFCLAVPVDEFRREGLDRALIRRAMKGVMPEAVRLGRRRGRQAADLGFRLLASRDEILQALGEMENHALTQEVLDLPKMRRVFAGLERQVDRPNTNLASTVLMRGLMVGLFLRRF